jgi:hypothetical protein
MHRFGMTDLSTHFLVWKRIQSAVLLKIPPKNLDIFSMVTSVTLIGLFLKFAAGRFGFRVFVMRLEGDKFTDNYMPMSVLVRMGS